MNDETRGPLVPDDDPDRTEFRTEDQDPTLAAPQQQAPTDLPADLPQAIGKYRILGKLGEGGMGVVLEAEQQSPRRRVALKVIRGGHFVDDEQIRMFQREADTLALLKHPHIGAIYESGHTDGGRHFFAMELVRGKTLDRYLQDRPATLDRAELRHRLELFRKIADAVHYAHQRGVIHRDLKPSNIVVPDEEGAGDSAIPAIKILDFGLARITEGDLAAVTMQSEIGLIKGTLPYMSPEQARGLPAEIDLRTDVYALGVILYEMLVGRRPYDTEKTSLIEAVRVIHEEPPRPLRQVWPGKGRVDEDLETIVGKALEKETEDRYGSAAALSEDIGRYLTSQPILARPPSTAYQLRKLVARNKLGTAFVVTVLLLLIGFGLWMSVLWRQSEMARTRAEASKLLALGRIEFDTSPSSALAYATASLQLADDPATRRFALEALWRGPTALIARQAPTLGSSFLADGDLLAVGTHDFESGESALALLSAEGGDAKVLVTGPQPPAFTALGPDNDRLYAHVLTETSLRAWSWPEGASVAPPDLGTIHGLFQSADRRFWLTVTQIDGSFALVRQWDSRSAELIGERRIPGVQVTQFVPLVDVDPDGEWLAWAHEGRIEVGRFGDTATEPSQQVGMHENATLVLFHPTEPIVVSAALETGELRFWSLDPGPGEPLRTLASEPIQTRPRFDPTGRYLASGVGGGRAWIWDLQAPPDAGPVVLERSNPDFMMSVSFHPHLPWLFTADQKAGALWSLSEPWPLELHGHENRLEGLAFDPRGRWLASASPFGEEVRLRPLTASEKGRLLPSCPCRSLAFGPAGEQLAAVVDGTEARLYRLHGEEPRVLGQGDFWEVAFSPDGRFVAASGGQFVATDTVVKVWDLGSGEEIVLDAGDSAFVIDVQFLSDNRVVGSGESGVRLWDLESRTFETLLEGPTGDLDVVSDDSRLVVLVGENLEMRQGGRLVVVDLDDGGSWELEAHGSQINALAVNANGTEIATGDTSGVVRYGSLDGSEPHLLLGHPAPVESVAFDPGGRWIATGDTNGGLRLWPVPDGQPLHAVPLRELLDRLLRLTNYRVVADDSAPDGYRLDIAPFEGWLEVPTW